MKPRERGSLGATTWDFPWRLFLGPKLGVSLCLCGLGESTLGYNLGGVSLGCIENAATEYYLKVA